MQADKTALILGLVRQIPYGRVASYGQIAGYLPGATPRMVGFAMAGQHGGELAWHRVINSRGAVSGHAAATEQRRLLEAEGLSFDAAARIDWARSGWNGPDPQWLLDAGLDPEAVFTRTHGRFRR